MVKIPGFHCRGHGFDPRLGNQDPTCHGNMAQYTLIISTVWETRKLINSMSKLSSLHFLKKENRILESLGKIDIFN